MAGCELNATSMSLKESFRACSEEDGYRSGDSSESASTTAGQQFAAEGKDLKGLDRPKTLLAAFAGFVHQRVVSGHHRSFHTKDHSAKATLFCGSHKANICIKQYIERIALHSKCSPICFVGAFVYLQRLAQKDDKLALCHRSVHRMLITSVLIAAKLLDDKFYSNSFYARIGGISTRELNRLELELLRLLDFRAFVSPQELTEVVGLFFGAAEGRSEAIEALERRLSGHGRKRGNEGPQPESEVLQPAKLQHDSHSDQVLVIAEARSGRSKGIVREAKENLRSTSLPPLTCKSQADDSPLSSSEVKAVHVQRAICSGGN